jgi:hypothetical protein
MNAASKLEKSATFGDPTMSLTIKSEFSKSAMSMSNFCVLICVISSSASGEW